MNTEYDKYILILKEFEKLKSALNFNNICIVDINKVFEIIRIISNYSQRIKNKLDTIYEYINSDIEALKNCDPASKNYNFEQILSIRVGSNYLIFHRLLHELAKSHDIKNSTFLAELIVKNVYKSVDIHPLAQIWKAFALDHAHWVVIWATTIMWNSIKMYHWITLWWTWVEVEDINEEWEKFQRRHPRIWNNVMIWMWTNILWPCSIPDSINIWAWVKIVNRKVELPKWSSIIKNQTSNEWLVKLPDWQFKIMWFEKIKDEYMIR